MSLAVYMTTLRVMAFRRMFATKRNGYYENIADK
jgi:hypothetical protein